jgi:hypothetical protein
MKVLRRLALLPLLFVLGCVGEREYGTYEPARPEPEQAPAPQRDYRGGGGGCFPAGTPVLTENGLQNIETVVAGTKVWAMNPRSGNLSLQPAVRTTVHDYQGDIIHVRFNNSIIEVTGNHPFWVSGGQRLELRPAAMDVPVQERGLSARGRWVEARDLQRGDILTGLNEQPLRIEEIEKSRGQLAVYNVTAAGQHTYAVHALGVVVHNKGSEEAAMESYAEAPASRQAAEVPKASKEADLGVQLAAASGVPRAVEKRARIYSGFCRLMVNEVEEAKQELETLAGQSGGYVESIAGTTMTLRVPAERFREIFDAVLDMGEVIEKSIETYDVSDTLRDQQSRLELAERSRERLYQLLERTEDVKERLAILREIRRLTEQIEQIRLSLELLRNQIALSRITVELVPRRPESDYRYETIPFPWIAGLDPLYASLPRLSRRVSFTLTDDFAVFESRKSFRAESPEGTRVRIGSLRNRPAGDELFWQKALVHHLGPRFRESELLEAGPFRAVIFTSKDTKPFSYLVAVTVKRKHLYVLEAFFPDSEARGKRLDTILSAMREIEIK